jgi:nucleoside-diphosphate-sugar epimerase
VFASSGGTIYGEPDPSVLPVDETHSQHPVSPYGVAKKVVSDYLFAYKVLHGLDFTSLALANVYGPRQDPHGEAGVVAIFAGLLLDEAVPHLRRQRTTVTSSTSARRRRVRAPRLPAPLRSSSSA